MEEKYQELLIYLKSLGKVAVAFSSGVDSTFLLYAAKEALGDQVVAITGASHSFPGRELREAKEYCEKLGVKQVICETNELSIEGFAENPKNRCYICKKALFQNFLQAAKDQGCDVMVEGSNVDDEGDYRPGAVAIKELGVLSPLKICGYTKQEIRDISKVLGVPTWDKPSYACLSSRFPYGERITAEKLQMIDKAEELLLSLGFLQFRVRIHGMMARIEILPEQFEYFMKEEIRMKVYEELKQQGFTYVSLDLLGYRTGSMNETILKKD